MSKIFLYLLLLVLPLVAIANDRQVNYVSVEGNNRITSSEIIEYSGLQIGKVYDKSDVANLIKTLFSTNLFKNIQIKLDNNTLYIQVIERPLISKIIIDGNNLIETEQILNSLKGIGISQSKPYSRNLIDKVQQELVRLYYDNGRYSSSINLSEKNLENNIIELSLQIDEGEASTIKEIKIIGNNTF
jgi:outer membrane protein insertion porin family